MRKEQIVAASALSNQSSPHCTPPTSGYSRSDTPTSNGTQPRDGEPIATPSVHAYSRGSRLNKKSSKRNSKYESTNLSRLVIAGLQTEKDGGAHADPPRTL